MIFALLVAALTGIGTQSAGLLVEGAAGAHQVNAGLASGEAVEASFDALGHHFFAGVLADADDAGSVAVVAVAYAIGHFGFDTFEGHGCLIWLKIIC